MRIAAAFCLALAGCDDANSASVCAGYVLPESSSRHAAPASALYFDFNGDGLKDTLATGQDLSGTMSLNCGDGEYADVLRSATPIKPVGPGPDGWMTFTLDDTGDRFLLIGEERYRFSMAPFENATETGPVIAYDDSRYAVNFPACKTLGIRAPLYSDFVLSDDPEKPVTFVSVTLSGEAQRIETASSHLYSQPRLHEADVNGDDEPDLLAFYSDKYGSGSDDYAAVLLGCGAGAYAISGSMRLGPSGTGNKPERVHDGFVVKWLDRQSLQESGEQRYS